MTTYTATFFTVADYATRPIEADTPEKALERARAFYDDHLGELEFRSYDSIEALDQIEICGDGTAISWESTEYRLRLAAGDLLAALERAVAALNTVPRFKVPNLDTDSYAIAALCDRAIARAKGHKGWLGD